MSNDEQVPDNAIEILDPVEQMTITNVVRSASMAAGLTPWQQHQIEWHVRKERGKLIVELAKIESQTVLTEAVVMSRGRVEAARERAAVETLAEQLRSLQVAGELLDDALNAASRLSEDSRALIQSGTFSVAQRFVKKVERRAGKLV
jgi:hypothetical protein